MRGSGLSMSRASLSTSKVLANDKTSEIDPLWEQAIAHLDKDTITQIATLIDKQRRPGDLKNPVNHPAVQDLRQYVNSGKKIASTMHVSDYELHIYKRGPVISMNMGSIDNPTNTLVDFHWNWETIPNGVNVFKDVCSEDAERVFYGVMAVVLSHRTTTLPIDLNAVKVTFYVPRLFNRHEDKVVKIMSLRTRVRQIFHSKSGQSSLQTLRDRETDAYGGATVHTGPRGGKYILKGNTKTYV